VVSGTAGRCAGGEPAALRSSFSTASASRAIRAEGSPCVFSLRSTRSPRRASCAVECFDKASTPAFSAAMSADSFASASLSASAITVGTGAAGGRTKVTAAQAPTIEPAAAASAMDAASTLTRLRRGRAASAAMSDVASDDAARRRKETSGSRIHEAALAASVAVADAAKGAASMSILSILSASTASAALTASPVSDADVSMAGSD
jgi:hypothetical protein